MVNVSPVPLGPFSGGMNNEGELATINGNELALVVNMEFDIDGSLKNRPALTAEQSTSPQTGTIQMLGWYTPINQKTYLVFATATDTRLYDVDLKTVTTIASFAASGAVQYDNKIVMVSSTVAGGYWEGGVYTACPTFPPAGSIVFYLERFWVFGPKGTTNATTLYYSNLNVISPPSSIYTFDTANNFIIVGRGDGQWITALQPDPNALIIFRSHSTYVFQYSGAVANGTLRVISANIGAENPFSVVTYNGYYYVVSGKTAYALQNLRFTPLNTRKLKFNRGTLSNGLTADVRLSVFADRLLLWYYGVFYAYQIITNTWATWQSPTTNAAHFLEVPLQSLTNTSRVAIATTGENLAARMRFWRCENDPLGTGTGESMSCMIRTKAYDSGPLTGARRVIISDMPSRYKRRLWWAVESRSSNSISGIEFPLVVPLGGVTWNDMCLQTWNTLSLGTWNNPLLPATSYSDSSGFAANGPQVTVTKFSARNWSLRSYKEVYLTCDGTTKTSPARIYSITDYLIAHDETSAKVS